MHQRERKIAAQCSLTLVTGASHEFHSFIGQLSRTNHLSLILRVPALHYDLISIPAFRDIEHDARRMRLLIENICLAVDVHSAEKVCVLGYDDIKSVYECLRREFNPRFPNLSFAGVFVGNLMTVPAFEPSHRLVVTCMDFRLHHEAGLQGMVTEPSAWLTYPGAAFAGVDSQTSDLFFSDLAHVIVKEQVRKVTLISHTDCAKYAAKYFWQNEEEERKQLTKDLRVVARRIRGLFSGVDVLCAIAKVQDDVVKELIPIV